MTRLRLLLVAVLTTAGVASGPAAAHADTPSGGANNVVVVTNKTDNALRARSRATVSHDPGPKVANQNVASARATCTGCRTVAAAIQVVVVEGDVNDFQPANAAVALNDNCHSCQTFAYARQVVFSPGRRVKIGDDAQERIDGINGRISALVRSTEPFPQLTTDLDSLTQQLSDVVAGEIQRAGSSSDRGEHRQVDEKDS